MRTEEINIAIAEKVGWSPHPENHIRELRYRSWRRGRNVVTYSGEPADDCGIGDGYDPLPKYNDSLDLMHEVEKVMNRKEWNKYVLMLARVIAKVFDTNVKVSVPTNVLISASSNERAEAFLRVFGLWR